MNANIYFSHSIDYVTLYQLLVGRFYGVAAEDQFGQLVLLLVEKVLLHNPHRAVHAVR